MIPTAYQPALLALLIFGSLIAWAAGYRLFRFVLTLSGFAMGAAIATTLVGGGDRTLMLFVALGAGAVGAMIMFFGYFVGVALIGAVIGAVGVHMIWSRLGSDPHAFVVILAAVAGAGTAMVLQRYVIIIATAFAGGWFMLWGAMHFQGASAGITRRPSVWMVYPFDLSPGRRWVLASWIAIGLVGMLIQLRFTGRSKPAVRKAKKPKADG
ncbi:MAG TPA: DUF4203 domain-containing protein [Vicinamibacterales bacterium]|nr:DUF4203 domain-containing protein [Vicinamibacterales bacterium]